MWHGLLVDRVAVDVAVECCLLIQTGDVAAVWHRTCVRGLDGMRVGVRPVAKWPVSCRITLSTSRQCHTGSLPVGMKSRYGTVDGDVGMAESRPVAGTGPKPIVCEANEPASDGIIVNVLNRVVNRLGFVQVVIVPRSGLPEAMLGTAGGAHGESFEEHGVIFLQEPDRFIADRLLDQRQDLPDLAVAKSRPDQQVDVFRHDHPSPQIELVFCSSFVQFLDEPQSRPVLG